MKLTDLSIVFIIITLPFLLVLNIKADDLQQTTYKKIEINRILDTAVEDGTSSLLKEGDGKKLEINKEKAVQDFFNSLYVNFDVVANNIAQKKVQGYIPCIAVVDYDGYYLLSSREFKDVDGLKQIQMIWSPKKSYSYCDANYVYSFTLSDFLTVYDISEKKFITGTADDLAGLVSGGIIKDKALFDQVRRKTIIDSIKRDVNEAINNHNSIAKQFGITYHFTLPPIKDPDWNRTINDVGMICFFQGYPVGVSIERINSFAIGGARLVKTPKYFLQADSVTGIKYYHRENCTDLLNKDIVMDSRAECALNGYLPCKKCNP